MTIQDQKSFESFVERLKSTEVFAIDTEFIRETTFRPRLCLIQIAFHDAAVVVDLFGVDNVEPLLEVICDAKIQKVVHAGQQDMEIFFAMRKESPRNVFDTQIAAALLGHGEGIGYSRLVEKIFSTALNKRETYTDWSQRPLTRSQTEYALDDVRYLLPLREKFLEELQQLQRDAWFEEELKRYESPSFYERDPETMYRKIGGAGNLARRELAALQELAAWRESEAEARDRPRNRIVSERLLVEIARRSPTSVEDLRAIRGVHPRILRRWGAVIVERVARALNRPPSDYPPLVEKRPRDDKLGPVVDLLETLLKVKAAELRIAPGYMASRKDLYALARAVLSGEEASFPVLEGWRGEHVGQDLRALLEGRVQLSIEPEKGRVCFGRRR